MTADRTSGTLQVEVWSDFVCPFCYMGEHKLKAGIDLYGGTAEIVYRSFQLRPDLEPGVHLNFITMFSERRGLSASQTRQLMVAPTADGRALGLELDFEHARPTNTRLAHELLHFAKSEGRQDVMAERIFKAYFTESQKIGDPQTLASLAADVGLERQKAAQALAARRFGPAVEADIAAARTAGVNSVPHAVIDGNVVVSGSQAPEIFASALNRRMIDARDSSSGNPRVGQTLLPANTAEPMLRTLDSGDQR